MNNNATVWFTTQVEGFHFWLDAPKEVSFLRDKHRHVFHIRVEIEVNHDDRDVEFIMAKREVDQYMTDNPINGPESCEMIARRIGENFDGHWSVVSVTVSEDNENGATVEFEDV